MSNGNFITGLENMIRLKNYVFMALEPVHVGAGGYRLGRVDNTIIREPATTLPKLPGTGLAGVARSYTAMAVQAQSPFDPSQQKYLCRQLKPRGQGEPPPTPLYDYTSCAGKGGEEGAKHCCQPNCPVCVPFGFSDGKNNRSFQGLASFADARIFLFPVSSMKGPVWLTSPETLASFQEDNDYQDQSDALPLTLFVPGSLEPDRIVTSMVEADQSLNLGWLLFRNKNQEAPLVFGENGQVPQQLRELQRRVVLVNDEVFSRLVNDNLEVRTSVAIDPATGAAEKGFLYTYEALPRGTVLWFPVRYQSPQTFLISNQEVLLEWTDMISWVERGIRLMELLGVGGKGSRGMGRLKCLNLP